MEDTNKLLNQILDKVSEIKTDTNILKDRLTSVEKAIIKLALFCHSPKSSINK